MDVPRPGVGRRKWIRRILLLAGVLLTASAGTYSLSRLQPAAPAVARATLWPDKVKRGPMLRDVRGAGTLVPETFRWVPARRDGLVEKIHVRIGDTVAADTLLAEFSNPDLVQAAIDAALQVKAAEADLANMRAGHQNAAINQHIAIATMDALAKRAELQAATDDELFARGLTSQISVRLSRLEAENSAAQVERERQRLEISSESARAQIAAAEARLEQLRAASEMRNRQVEELKVYAAVSGILQQLSIEEGQRVSAGTTIAKVAEAGRLKAQLRVPETQAKDVALGQVASIDTRNGIVRGRVVHIDPAAIQGTVSVDVQLDGELPRGARPDLNVDGTIEIERLDDVLYVGRPAHGAPHSMIQLFKILPGGEAIRTRVRIGRVSVNSVEILDGLQEGDEVILSDMSAYDAYDRLRLN